MTLVVLLISILVLIAANALLIRRRNVRRHRLKVQRNAHSPEPLVIRTATIADDMVPLLNQLELDGARIDIVGGDGYYLMSSNGSRLKQGIEGWIGAGATVSYYLVRPSDDAREAFDALASANKGRFSLTDLSGIRSDSSGPIVDEMRNRHPTLVRMRSGERAMWVEYMHPDQSSVAYNVKYVSPEAMADDKEQVEFQRYETDLAQLAALAS